MISEFLSRHGIIYRYDERMRIIEGHAIRPDFYLPEFDLYIEYWGMDTAAASWQELMDRSQEMFSCVGNNIGALIIRMLARR